ncbi:MAG: putative LPS assembly protein LptD, partial [Bacteroidota bacterium]|nr:putative LPS assembly protein LptD [Bacteroidota bacterium]
MTPLRRTFKAFFPGLLFILCCLTFPVFNAGGQTPASAMLKEPLQAKPRTAVDSLPAKPGQKDSLAKSDTLSKKKKQTITEIVDYEARDSLVFLAGGVGKLYGQAKVNYDKMSMEAGYIQLNSDSSLMYAIGRTDSAGAIVENPVLKDKSGEYTCKQIRYNFKTGKGLISQVITQQGEGYIVSGLTKKTAEEELCMIDGKYTTCDNHDHPHFYLDLSKAKVVPGKYMVSGPAHLVMEDVHLPLFIPFGYFPISHKYSSGILSPSYGDELSQGFYLKDLGYYFAINDYVDVALTSEIYSKGSWGLTGRTNYRVKYKYSGSFNASYLETVTSEKNLPDYA